MCLVEETFTVLFHFPNIVPQPPGSRSSQSQWKSLSQPDMTSTRVRFYSSPTILFRIICQLLSHPRAARFGLQVELKWNTAWVSMHTRLGWPYCYT